MLAKALGEPCPVGPNHCFYCGGACGDDFSTGQYIADTFNSTSQVACPKSRVVCGGCVSAMQCKRAMVGRDKPQRTWTYSWVVTAESATPYTKADLSTLARLCLDPPTPPFAIALADSGQKHLLYLTPVNQKQDRVTVCLETQNITYRPAELAARLAQAKQIAAACGKPALLEELNYFALMDYYADGEDIGQRWESVAAEPLSQLAAWLCPAKETCQHEFPRTYTSPANVPPDARGIPAAAGRDRGPGLFG